MPVKIDVKQELEMIARLQDTDDKLMDLIQEKGDLPRMVKRLQEETKLQNGVLLKIQEKLTENATDRRAIEGQNQLARVKQDKYKEQLYQVTTNREYDAITQEVENIQADIEANESNELSLMEEDEQLTQKAADLKETVEESNSELSEREQELDEKEEETEQEELELNHEREKLIVRIKKPVLTHYERIRAAKGVGAAPLFSSACGSCYAVVPPQRQTEIRLMNDVILCESCGVILLPER